MPMPQTNQSSPMDAMSIDQLQKVALNVVETLCGAVAMPVEIILRPFYGSRFLSPAVITLASAMMLFLPLISSVATGVANIIPFAAHVRPPQALFDMGSFARLYFLLGIVHGMRVYRRMLRMDTEQNSRYEGPPLPLFLLIPGGSFWRVRILFEPAAVFISASVLEHLFLIQSGLAAYLHFAAFCLAMKNFIGWYRAWEFLRDVLDSRIAAPIIAKFVENTASNEELSSIHLANLPKNTNPELRRAVAVHIARAFSPGTTIPESQGASDANHR
jgi:hypothetical protein